MPRITSYYMTDAEETSIEHVTDFSPEGIAAIAAAEENGAILRAVYDDGTEAQVEASQVSTPNIGETGRANIGASFSAAGTRGGASLMKAQQTSVVSGTVSIGGVTLEFVDGLLVAVS